MSLFESLKCDSKFLVSEEDGGCSTISSDSVARVPAKSGKIKRRAIKKVKVLKMLESHEFDSSHVSSILSKLSAASVNEPGVETKDFGFSDSDGNIIKVSVNATQADEFKATLSKLLADYTENDQSIEVAEILFNLRNKFDIVDVQWPKVVEDEEPVQTGNDVPDNQNADNPEVDDVAVDEPAPAPAAQPGGDVSGAMDAMLSALIADAEARRQEAVARAAEARAQEADAAARMSAQKMSAEEEVADMEAFYNSQNEEQKEAKKLAKLAKYRHQMRQAQQNLQSTAYDSALSDQEDDNFMGMDTGEDEKDPSINNQMHKAPKDGEEMDPTSNLDTELKPSENEEVSGQHSNLFKALMAMRHRGVRT